MDYTSLIKEVNIPELVKSLRHCNGPSFLTCRECQYNNNMLTCPYKMLRDAADVIEALQTQLPKQGEWVRVEDGESYHYECSRCGERPLYSRYGDVVLSGVCPMCGAKMEVQDG